MVRLLGGLYMVSGEEVSHPWDASAYLIAGDNPVLIDCGGTEGYPALKKNLSELGYRPQDIRQVIATHGHWDHLSAMAQLRKESDAQLFMHDSDRDPVETGDTDRTASFLYELPFPPVEVDGRLEDEGEFEAGGYRFHVIHTPGHTPGSVSFWAEIEGSKILIAGDALWGGYHPRIRSNLDEWSDTLDKLLVMDFDFLTIGHGPPRLIPDANARLREARRQLGVYFHPWFEPFPYRSNGRGG